MENQKSNRVVSAEPKTSDRVNSRLAVRLAKFRAWNHIVGRMSAEYTLQELHKEEVNFMNVSFLESTGVTDKSEKEIFEHDILTYTVSCGSENGMVEKDKNGRHVFHAIVVYENGQFIAKQINGDGSLTFGFPLSVLSKEKIVGNYYQRPGKCFLIS